MYLLLLRCCCFWDLSADRAREYVCVYLKTRTRIRQEVSVQSAKRGLCRGLQLWPIPTWTVAASLLPLLAVMSRLHSRNPIDPTIPHPSTWLFGSSMRAYTVCSVFRNGHPYHWKGRGTLYQLEHSAHAQRCWPSVLPPNSPGSASPPHLFKEAAQCISTAVWFLGHIPHSILGPLNLLNNFYCDLHTSKFTLLPWISMELTNKDSVMYHQHSTI